MSNIQIEEKLKKYFGDMLVYKTAANGKFFSSLSLPSYMRDWLVMRFADSDGVVDKEKVSQYVKDKIPQRDDWKQLQFEMIYNQKRVKLLAKVKIEFDMHNRLAYFSLPDFGVPKSKGEAIADWSVVERNKNYLLGSNDVWGIIELECVPANKQKDSDYIIKLVSFKPFCPYTIDLDYYTQARAQFTTEEWIDVLLSAIDYNPNGYDNIDQKLTMLSRMLPFVEKRLNIIELAPKGTGKSYLFSQLSKYGWLISGGSISRAKMFYDISKSSLGLVAHYDYVAFDEIQSIKFTDKMEMQGALKGYLESGEYRVGAYKGVGDSGLVLLGNIDVARMDTDKDMFGDLPDLFQESALIDRFHGFIKGWDIPRMKEDLKANGWSINVEYFSEILHMLREELVYRAVVDELLKVPSSADTRDTEAIKRLATAFMKLLFPHVRSVEDVDKGEFERYCLTPALNMRGIIKKQLGIMDKEFEGKEIPYIALAHEPESGFDF